MSSCRVNLFSLVLHLLVPLSSAKIVYIMGFEFSGGLLAPTFTVGSPKCHSLRARLAPRLCMIDAVQCFTIYYQYQTVVVFINMLVLCMYAQALI